MLTTPSVFIDLPKEFSYELNLAFLRRSPKELLHQVTEHAVRKVIVINGGPVLLEVTSDAGRLRIDVLNKPASRDADFVRNYVREWFDLDTDLSVFYRLARRDEVLAPLVKKFHGYRIMSHPDLFESLIWAVLGQQINVQFAYTLKQRFVEKYGTFVEHGGAKYFLFPTPEVVMNIKAEDLLPLQFSRQKAKYTINIAEAFANGIVSKESLRGKSLLEARDELVKIKGIGNWTANYALMRTFRYPDAFPLEDVALHKALQIQFRMRARPTLDRVKKIFRRYKGWEAYATIYLWKSL